MPGLSVKAVFWVYRLLAIVSLHAVVREGRREAGRGGAPVFLLMRALIPSWGVLLPWSNYLPQAPSPDTITLGIRISTYELWGAQTFSPWQPPYWLNSWDITYGAEPSGAMPARAVLQVSETIRSKHDLPPHPLISSLRGERNMLWSCLRRRQCLIF